MLKCTAQIYVPDSCLVSNRTRNYMKQLDTRNLI